MTPWYFKLFQTVKLMLPAFTDFSSFESDFLNPLIQWRHPRSESIRLDQMERWQLTNDGRLEGSHFLIEGRRTSFTEEPNQTQPPTWDQPLYKQGTGTLLLVLDEQEFFLVKAVFEPGNVNRGYENRGLILCTTTKFSPANLAQQLAQGRSPAFSALLQERETQILLSCPAPGDGARADKQNQHHLLRANRSELHAHHEKLAEAEQRLFALIDHSVLGESLKRGIVGEHLRDLSSLRLFV